MTYSAVNCAGCTLCCKNDAIMLHPEHGDILNNYIHEPYKNPLNGKMGFMVSKKPNGECIYLSKNGCSIHEAAPFICKIFDCGNYVLSFSRDNIKKMIINKTVSRDVIKQGRRINRERKNEQT